MRIAVPKEIVSGEKRVALVPEVVPQLIKLGHSIQVERSAGTRAGFTDAAYVDAGATLAADALATYRGAELILKVQRPANGTSAAASEIEMIERGATLIGLLQPASDPRIFESLAKRGITACSMELVPRTTRAQMMDALSSQSTVAGYKAVLLAANALQKFFPC